MADPDDETDFADNGFDQLPQSTLRSLEYSAISSTQQQVAARRQKQYNQVTRPFKLSAPSAPAPAKRAPSPQSSDYGLDDDEDVIDLDEPPPVYSHSLAVPHPPTLQQPTSNPVQVHRLVDTTAPDAFDQEPSTFNQEPLAFDQDDPSAFNQGPVFDQEEHSAFDQEPSASNQEPQRRDQIAHPAVPIASHSNLDHIKQLESELAAVRLSLQTAQANNQKQAGEISIIRAKQDKDARDYESQIALLQKLHADESSKQKADIHAAKKDIELFETNNRFLEHDLAQARDERAKRVKSYSNHVGHLPSKAPQKLPYRDGFDDHEILLLSPSKPKDKSKPPTPKVGDKRKRNISASPRLPLQLGPPPKSPPSAVNTADLIAEKETLARLQDTRNLQFQMIQRLMNHRPLYLQDRTLETLGTFAFPSLPNKSVADLIAESFSMFTGVEGGQNLPSYACNFLSELWARCLMDKFYTPIYLLLDLYEFVLALSLKSPEMAIIERFVPLATKTIDLIAVPRARPVPNSEANQQDHSADSGIDSHILDCIDVDQILSLLHSMAFDASVSTEACQAFWKKMEFDFTLMMLNKAQPLPHIVLVLQMVGSSAMPESFGVIADNVEKQTFSEIHTIDRLTTLLFERPEAPSDELPYEDTEIAKLQIETIRALNAIAITKRGSVVLAQHRTAIGRLVRLLHVQVTKLYDLQSTTIQVSECVMAPVESSTIHDLTATSINLTVRLIYHLLTNYGDDINLREKLVVIPGGHHKFLVSLTRLAFSEQLVFEAGIEEEAVDAAHEILDGILSPEEGEAVVQAIETPRGTTAARASAPR